MAFQLEQVELLVYGYLAQYACQAVICAFIASLMLTLSRWQSSGLMRWWGVSWAAHAVYLTSGGLALYAVDPSVGMGLVSQPSHPIRLGLSLISLTSGALQIYALAKGWGCERKDTNDFSKRRLLRVICGFALLAVAATVLLHVIDMGSMRFKVKVGARAWILAAFQMWIGVAVLRRRSLLASIRVWLGLGLIAFSIKHLHFGYRTFFLGADYEAEFLLQFIELGLHTVIASPMLLWVCMRFVEQTDSQQQELQRRASMLEEQDVLLARRQRLSAIGRMAAGVAHDFNNVLSVIQGWTDILRHDSKLDELGREGVGEIESAAKQAGAISQQLMLFGGKRQLDPVLISLTDAISEARRLTPQLDSRPFQSNVGASVPMVRGDRSLLVAALQNLLINAHDATEQGGDVQISATQVVVGADEARELDVSAGDYVRVTVADGGHGMPDDVRQQVFEPFFTTKQHGNGLGLPSVHGFARQSGGTVVIESELGEGTSIHVYLPVATHVADGSDVELPTVEISKPAPVTSSSKQRVLVVDDEPSIARHAARVLSRAGFAVSSETSPQSALEHARALGDELALLVTDVRMPGMSGMQLASAIGAQNPKLRVLFITGFAGEADVDAVGLTARPAVLQKPISGEGLLDAVRGLLQQPVSPRAEQP